MKTVSAALLAALALAGCGGDGDSAASDGGVDRAFAAKMIPHHQSAVEMAELARERAESAFVRRLAGDIIRTQQAEIATLRREDRALAAAGVTEGSLGVPEDMKGMDHDAAELRSADPFDRAFLEMMVPHHVGAVEMSEAELAKGSDPELKVLARRIIDAQEQEIKQMRAELVKLGGGGGHGSGHSG